MKDSIEIRRCHTLHEMQSCVLLQKEVWGFTDIELVPLRLFVVGDKIGGQVIGAWDAGEMVGFSYSIPGVRDAKPYLHSHMTAVREGYRDRGLGRRLKLFQREDALSNGIRLIEWTFDPLEIKNSYFNLQRLGALARRYNINQYGITTSPLQGGLPTDRLVAEWWLDSARVQAALAGERSEAGVIAQRIRIPAEVSEWKARAETRDRAHTLQARVRDLFLKAFDDGLACAGYELDAEGNGHFLLRQVDGLAS